MNRNPWIDNEFLFSKLNIMQMEITSNSVASILMSIFFLSSTFAESFKPKNGALKITPAMLRFGLFAKKLRIVKPPIL